MSQNKGFETEAIARERARADFATTSVVIILSQGQYYVEPEDDCGLIRTWEREVYRGLGCNAVLAGDLKRKRSRARE